MEQNNRSYWVIPSILLVGLIFKDKLMSLFKKNKSSDVDEEEKDKSIDKVQDLGRKDGQDLNVTTEYPSLEGLTVEDIPDLQTSYISNFVFEDWNIDVPSINSIQQSSDSPYTKAAAEAWNKTVALSFRKWQSFMVTGNTYSLETKQDIENRFNRFTNLFIS